MAAYVASAQTSNEPLYREGQVIVKFKSGQSMARGNQTNSGLGKALQLIGGTEARQLMPLSGTTTSKSRKAMVRDDGTSDRADLSGLYVIHFDKKKSVESTIETLKKLNDVAYAEPNYIVKAIGMAPKALPNVPQPEMNEVSAAPSFNDPNYSEQWGLQAINMPALWEKPVINSTRPVIAILDTGVDITHPDLAANIWKNEAEKGNDEDGNGFVGDVHGWDFINESPEIYDTDGHGTHCAGIAAAVGNNGIGIVGANPDALIMPLKVLDDGGSGTVAACIRALDYAIANGADIISMSFARSCPGKSTHEGEMEAMEEAAKYAVLVASAGNDGVCMNQCHQTLHGSGKFPDPYFPAAYPFVIGVQASNTNGELADFSNFDCKRSPTVTVYGERKTPLSYETWAPGVGIISTLPSGEYGLMDGTSTSCPLVAGAVSRLLQSRKDIDNQELLTMVSLTADNKCIDMLAMNDVQDSEMPKHAVDEIFTSVIDGNEITFRVTSATTVQVGDGSYPAIKTDGAIEELVFPEEIDGLKVTTIGSYAFYCVNVDKIVLPNTLTFIANFAFESWRGTSMDIPNGVIDIGEKAFSDSYIKSINIPKSVECISDGAFALHEIKSIQVDSKNAHYHSQNNSVIETSTGTLIAGIDYIPNGVKAIGNCAFLNRDFETIDIPNTVITIGEGAFAGCSNLKSADIPESVTSIGFSAYNMCESLKSVHLSKNVQTIGNGAFGYCQNIESFTIDSENPFFDSRENCNAIIETATNTLIHGFNCTTIPSTLEGIAYDAFYYCDKLESIYISKSVSRIDYCPFIGCNNLRSVVIDKDNPYYDSRDNCSAIIETATNKFLWGNQYSTIPSGVKILGIDAFWGAEFSGDLNMRIPEGVEIIEHGALNVMTSGGDVSFYIPSTIKHIDEYASQYAFKSLYCYRKTPLPISKYVFREVDGATLYVPKGQKPAYEKAKGWNRFSTIVEMDVEGADPPIEIEPIVEDVETTFGGNGDIIDEETDLSNTVIDNTYFNIDAGNGDGYDAELQAIVLNSTTSKEQMNTIQEAKVGDDAIRNNYSGAIFEVPASKGVVTVDVQTIGSHVLNVQIGKGEPTKVIKPEREPVEIKYNVSEPTYVYLYASSDGGSHTRASSATTNSVLLYGYNVTLKDDIQGDANGDKEVNVADIVKLVNDNAPQSEIDEVVDIIMKKK